MSVVRVVGSFSELARVMTRDMRDRQKRIERGIVKTATLGAAHVRKNVAFGELRDGTIGRKTSYGAVIETNAPHAEAVEKGSRPHYPPLAPLIKWVRLRGAQGLQSNRKLSRQAGTTTVAHARTVAAEIRSHMMVGTAGDAIAADAPEKIARAIQHAIGKRGTKPTWYMQKAIPIVEAFLDEQMKAAVPDR